MSTSDGSTADYYKLPAGATELQDLISHRNLNAQDGEIFRAIYRKGRASHSDELRDARKVLFYAQAEVKRLENMERMHAVSAEQFINEVYDRVAEPDSAIDDDSERMQAIGQNGNGGNTGSTCDGPSALYKLRRASIAGKALTAAIEALTPIANDIHEFDHNGHKI